MGSYWPPYAVATGDYYRPSSHCADVAPIAQAVQSSSSAAGFSDYQHSEIPMLLPGQWDAAALTQLQHNNSSLVIDLGNVNHLFLHGLRRSFTEQVVLVAKKGVLSGAWTMANLVMTYRSASWRDEALTILRKTSLCLGQYKVTLRVSPLWNSTSLDIAGAPLVKPKEDLSRNLGITRKRAPHPAAKATVSSKYHLPSTDREHQGPYMWWSTFISEPHTFDHVAQAVLQYFGRSQRPQFIAGEFNMPKGVVLIHFAEEPAVKRNFLTLENPARNTGFKVHHDLDIAKCRLQIERGSVPDRHYGHRCAVRGLGNPGQGVHYTSSWQRSTSDSRYGTANLPHSAHKAQNKQFPERPEKLHPSTTGELMAISSNYDKNTSSNSWSSGQIRDELMIRGTSATKASFIVPHTNHTVSESLAAHASQTTHSDLNHKGKSDVYGEVKEPEPSEIPNKITEGLPAGSLVAPKSQIAGIEKMISEEKSKVLRRGQSQVLNQDQQLSLYTGGATSQKTTGNKSYLSFADIELSMPLSAIGFPTFRDMLVRTRPWEVISTFPDHSTPGDVQQKIEGYACFIAHYHVDNSWDDKIKALNRSTKLNGNPKAQRVFAHFTKWFQQQKSRDVLYPCSFPYYGNMSKDAYSDEVRKDPGPSFLMMAFRNRPQFTSLQTSTGQCTAFPTASSPTDMSKSNELRKVSEIAAAYRNRNKPISDTELGAMLATPRKRSPSVASSRSRSSIVSSVMSVEPERMVLSRSHQLLGHAGEAPDVHAGPLAEALEVIHNSVNETNHSNASICTTGSVVRNVSSDTSKSYITATSSPQSSPDQETGSSRKESVDEGRMNPSGNDSRTPCQPRIDSMDQRVKQTCSSPENTEFEEPLRPPDVAFVYGLQDGKDKANGHMNVQGRPSCSDMSISAPEVLNARKRKADDERSSLEDIIMKSRRLQGSFNVANSHQVSSDLDQGSLEQDKMTHNHQPVISSILGSSGPQISSVQQDSSAMLPQKDPHAKSISQVGSSDLLDALEGALQRE